MELQDKLVDGLDVVKKLEGIYPKIPFVIAGGAVRDQLMGKPISDIDIYNTLDLKSKTVQKNFCLSLNHLFKDKLTGYPTITYDSIYSKFYLTSMEFVNGTIIEFISVPTSKWISDVIDTFDIGLCQTSIYKEKLWFSEKFEKDRDNKTLTLYPNKLTSSQIYRSISYHLPKLMRKFPNHDLRINYE